jgi:hypothetical protein
MNSLLKEFFQVYPPPQPVLYQQPYVATPQPVYQPQYPQYQPQQPAYQPQYGYPLPAAIAAPPIQAAPQPYPGYPVPMGMGYGQATYGQTGNEVLAGQMQFAQDADVNKKQEMKPADDDPFRMYWCRESDSTWTQRNRLTIDSGDIGDCRWYSMDGQFYCVRLSDG